jgi:hypothetical protein
VGAKDVFQFCRSDAVGFVSIRSQFAENGAMDEQKAEDFIKHHPSFRAISPGYGPRLPIKAVLPQVRLANDGPEARMFFFEKKNQKTFAPNPASWK